MNRLIAGLLKAVLTPVFRSIVHMPGRTHTGPLPALIDDERQLASRLRQHILHLSQTIPDRSLQCPAGLEAAASYIEAELASIGYQPKNQDFMLEAHKLRNVEAILPGTKYPEKILVLGAHYDTVPGTPGADDNASGIAAMLELARYFRDKPQPITLRFVAFSNEETYHYSTMGSYAYAQRSRQNGENIVGMFSLEMLGSFSDEEGSQNYPFPFSLFYPRKGNFLAFVGNTASKKFLGRSIGAFRKECKFPSYGLAAPSWVSDASRSDHLPFWQFDYPAVMLTDTSNFRYQHYHHDDDTVDKLDLESMARVVAGVSRMVKVLALS